MLRTIRARALLEVIGNAELFANIAQTFDHRAEQRNTFLGSALCRFKLYFAGDVDSLLAFYGSESTSTRESVGPCRF